MLMIRQLNCHGSLSNYPKEISRILPRAFQSSHCFGQDLLWRQMTTQQHLNCERESHSLLTEKCSPHILLICLNFFVCHECDLLQRPIKPSLQTITFTPLPLV